MNPTSLSSSCGMPAMPVYTAEQQTLIDEQLRKTTTITEAFIAAAALGVVCIQDMMNQNCEMHVLNKLEDKSITTRAQIKNEYDECMARMKSAMDKSLKELHAASNER